MADPTPERSHVPELARGHLQIQEEPTYKLATNVLLVWKRSVQIVHRSLASWSAIVVEMHDSSKSTDVFDASVGKVSRRA